uniref:XK-related protein n=1 Tax=Pelusios castaneus TaxID=367368 RepID=A0A8C8RVI1_9SAUR
MAGSGRGSGRPPPPPQYGLRDLLFALLGVGAFAADLVADLWAAASYVRAGHAVWGGLVLLLLGLSSLAVQGFSWAWYQTEPGESDLPPGLRLAALHLLQLGYPYRCCRALRVGWRVCRDETAFEEDQAYAVFLTHDISMLRLFETFLENTPQLTLVLAIILHTNKAELFQGLGICTAFLSVAWSLLDYHQSLRSFLQDKYELRPLSSTIYFLWNFLLVCPRVLAIALFAVLFPYGVALHFLSVWAAMLLWVWLQGTVFMESPRWEWLYRVTVAVILYFCWFNVAKGRTLYRSVIYHGFILVDSMLLAGSSFWYSAPLRERPYLLPVLLVGLFCYMFGLLLRGAYYKWFHPRLQAPCKAAYDEVDAPHGLDEDAVFRAVPAPAPMNRRLYQLAQNHFSVSLQARQNWGNGVMDNMAL